MTLKQTLDHQQNFDTWTDEQQAAHLLYEHDSGVTGGSSAAGILSWTRAGRFNTHDLGHWSHRARQHQADPEPRELELADKYPFGFVEINDVRIGLKQDGALMEPITIKQGDVLSMAWPAEGAVTASPGWPHSDTVPIVPFRCRSVRPYGSWGAEITCGKKYGHKKKHKFQIKWED